MLDQQLRDFGRGGIRPSGHASGLEAQQIRIDQLGSAKVWNIRGELGRPLQRRVQFLAFDQLDDLQQARFGGIGNKGRCGRGNG